MAYKFQLGAAVLSGSINVAEGAISGSAVSDTLAQSVVSEIDNGEIPIAKLAASTISGKSLGANLDALSVDDSSIEYSSGTSYNGSAASSIRIKAAGVTNDMLAGSIADSKLLQISTADKVAGSAVQLATASALENSTGLRIKAAAAGDGLALSAGQVFSVNVDNSSIETNSDSLRVKAAGITNDMLAGSIADSKLLQISTADKVAGSAVQVASNSAIEDDSGLNIKSSFAGSGLSIAEGGGDQVLSVGVDNSSVEINSNALRVKAAGVTNDMLAGSIADSKLLQISTADKVSLAALDIDGGTALGSAGLAQADLFIFDDGAGGTNKTVTFSNLEDSIFGNVSGDAAIGAGGSLTIANDAVNNNKLANIARGSIKVGGASNAPTDLDAKTSGQILVGDGTDIASVAVSGDISLAANGAVTMASAQTNITSILATDLVLGEDAQTAISFETVNQIDFKANNNVEMTITDSGVTIAGNLTV